MGVAPFAMGVGVGSVSATWRAGMGDGSAILRFAEQLVGF